MYISLVEFIKFYDLSTLEDRPKGNELLQNLRTLKTFGEDSIVSRTHTGYVEITIGALRLIQPIKRRESTETNK